jgi:hypothetical protein
MPLDSTLKATYSAMPAMKSAAIATSVKCVAQVMMLIASTTRSAVIERAKVAAILSVTPFWAAVRREMKKSDVVAESGQTEQAANVIATRIPDADVWGEIGLLWRDDSGRMVP